MDLLVGPVRTPAQLIAKAIASTSLWSSRHAKPVVATVLLATLVFGYGVTLITTNVDVADVLPRGNPNTDAAYQLADEFRSTFTQQVTFQLHVDDTAQNWQAGNDLLTYRVGSGQGDTNQPGAPQGAGNLAPNSQNITDEVYVRAMEELMTFIQERTDFTRTISINNIYALIHWTERGGEGVATEADFRLPGYMDPDEAQNYVLVDQAVKVAVLETVDTLASPSWNHAAMLFMPPADNTADMRELGKQIIDARDEWIQAVDDGETVFTIWGSDNPPDFTVDFPVANAHSSNLVEGDMVRLMPLIGAFIVVCLFIAFRNVRSIAISFTALGVGVVWTYGTMGYMDIALNTLNMTIVPLIMGVGIDYAIHMINEFLEHKAKGQSDAEAFEEAGGKAGLAMFIATLTTVLGLIVMMISPSLLMAQLGFLSALAIGSIYILTITFIPAALTLAGGTEGMGQSFSKSATMPVLARGVSRIRWLALVVVVLISIGTFASSQDLEREAFGDPGKNFPEGDDVREQHERGLERFYEQPNPDVKTNILTFRGPEILSPEAIQYYREIESNLATKDRIKADTLRTIPFFIETWLTVKNGVPCAGLVVANSNDANPLGGVLDPVLGPAGDGGLPCGNNVVFPDTKEEITAEIDAMFASPMRELASVIINHPAKNMGAMTFAVDAGTYDEAEEAWDQVWEAVAAANKTFGGKAPDGVQVAFVGNSATNYLFVAEQLPWLTYMSVASTIILFILVLTFTGNIKATFVATALAGMTSIWWLGLLPFIDIGLAITLMLPLVFIFNIGTDYAVHLIWSHRQNPDAREVWATTGKAILFSAITTAGAFAVFTFIRNVAVSRTMIATTLAIGVIFTATLLIIPIFYKVLAKNAKPTPTEAPKRVKAVKSAKD